MRLSLQQRILAITAAAILPTLAALVFNEISLRHSREREIHQLAMSTAEQAALEMDRLTSGTEGILRAIATAPAVVSLDPARCPSYLARLKEPLPQFKAITVFDLEGHSRCRSDEIQTAAGVSDRPYFIEAIAKSGRLVIGDYTISRYTGEKVLPFAMAVLDDQKKMVGVVAAGLSLDWLGNSLAERRIADNGSLTIADRHGTIIARQPFPEQFVGTVIPPAFAHLLTEPAPGTINVVSQDGTTRILGYVPVGDRPVGLYVSAGLGREEAFAAVNAATERSLALGLGGAVVSFALAWLLSRSLVSGPVRRISSTLAARRRGDDGRRTGLSADQGDLEGLGAEVDAYMDELNRGKLEREQAVRHQALLTSELSHRIKNLIATIQAVANQTFRGSDDASSSLKVFTGRLGAIAQAQQLLLAEGRPPATVKEAIAAAVSVFEPAPGERFNVEGPELRLRPRVALNFALSIHELCTNAVKYGALSVEGGRVEIAWTITPLDALRLTWTERGGPPVAPPTRRGFGTRMIERLLTDELGGTTHMEFMPQGLQCAIETPLAAIVEPAGVAVFNEHAFAG